MEQPNVLELTRRLGREPNVDTALHIMMWNLGDLSKSWTYSKWHTDIEQDKAYLAEARHALGSLLFQAEVVARLLGTTSKDSFNFGVMTVEDRIEDKEKKRGRFQSYVGDKLSG